MPNVSELLASMLATPENARVHRTEHAMIPQVGFVRMGPPKLPLEPRGPPAACSPPDKTETDTLHTLITPGGDDFPNMRWHAEFREWAPLVPFAGNRMAFTAQYLAAHGWTYGYRQ